MSSRFATRILRSRDKLANARVLNNIGLCYQSLAEYGTATSYFERAVAIETALAAGTPAVDEEGK